MSRRANARPDDRIAPSFTATLDGDMAAFDALPPVVRQAVRDLPVDAAAEPILRFCATHGPQRIMAEINRCRADIEQRMRDEMAEALAR